MKKGERERRESVVKGMGGKRKDYMIYEGTVIMSERIKEKTGGEIEGEVQTFSLYLIICFFKIYL